MHAGSDQPWTKPIREIIVFHVTTCNTRYHIRHDLIIFLELVAASPSRQLHQMKGRSLVSVHKPMIRNDPVDQCSRLLMDKPVVPMVWTSQRRLNIVFAQDSLCATFLKRFFVAPKRVSPSDSIVLSDLPAPAWLFCVSRKFP